MLVSTTHPVLLTAYAPAKPCNCTAAEKYDLSGVDSADFINMISELLSDYDTNIAPLIISSAYLHHEDRSILEL